MTLTEDQQKAVEEQKKNCPFCQIVADKIPSKKVYEDDKALAILDINPAAEGHILLLPKEHYPIAPLIPSETTVHLAKLTRDLAKTVREAATSPGAAVFIANGAAAGQQSPHFLIHIIPDEKLEVFDLPEKEIDTSKLEQAFKNNLKGLKPMKKEQNALDNIIPGQESTALFEDDVMKIMMPEKPAVEGHIKIIAKDCSHLDQLSYEEAVHLFVSASQTSSLVFEMLKAQGTNIIIRENPLVCHIIPRKQDDGLDFKWKATQTSDDMFDKLKDAAFVVGKLEAKQPEHVPQPELSQTENSADASYLERIP